MTIPGLSSHHPPGLRSQLSVLGCAAASGSQLSALSSPLSAFSFQLSAFRSQLSSFSFQVSAFRFASFAPAHVALQATRPAPAGTCSGLPPYCGCPPRATLLSFPLGYALSRGCSLPLMSPFGLPAAVLARSRPAAWFPAGARWHLFKFPVSSFFFPPLPPIKF